MAYNANKPAATDLLSISQGDIQGNFAAIKTLIDVNHGDFGAVAQGKHIFLNMPEQSTNIGTTSAVTGNFSGTAPAIVYALGQYFIVKSTTFTVASLAAGPQAMTSTGSATATFDAGSGAIVITGNNENPLSNVYFISVTDISDEGAVYSVEGTYSGVTELVYRRENNGTPISFSESGLGASQSNSWSRFPSGLVAKFGYANAVASGNFTVDLTTIGPVLTAFYNVQLTTASAGIVFYVSAMSVTTLTINASGAGNVYWQVLGK